MQIEYKRKASKLFWLGLVITSIGCFYDLSMQSGKSLGIAGDSLGAVGQAFVGLLFGILLPIARVFEMTESANDISIALLSGAILFLASAVLVFGCRTFAKGKGYSAAFGYLGLIGLAGVVILMFFPDRGAPARGPTR